MLKKMRKAITTSQKCGEQNTRDTISINPKCEHVITISEAQLRAWLSDLDENKEDRSKKCNKDQKQVVTRVVNQILLDQNWLIDKRKKDQSNF